MVEISDISFTIRLSHILAAILILLVGSLIVGTIAVNDYYVKNMPSSCGEFLGKNSFIWLPKAVSDLFEGDNVIIHFSMMNGNTIIVNGVVAPSSIIDLECGRTSDYDFEIWMSDANALELATSRKPTTTFVTLWRSGQIKIQANGIENQEKLEYADQLVAQDEPVPSWIRNIFEKYLDN